MHVTIGERVRTRQKRHGINIFREILALSQGLR